MIINLNENIIKKLTKTEYEIVKFINNNQKILQDLSIVDIAFETFSSPATVSRAIRKCGINGFNELRYKLTSKNENNNVHNIGEIINKSLIEARSSIENISLTNVLKIIENIKKSSRIYVLSRGLTEYVADEFTLKLQLLNCNVVSLKDPNIMKIKTNTDLSLIAYKHSHIAIKEFEVSSRLPLYIISRVIIDYMVSESENNYINK